MLCVAIRRNRADAALADIATILLRYASNIFENIFTPSRIDPEFALNSSFSALSSTCGDHMTLRAQEYPRYTGTAAQLRAALGL